MKLNYLRKDEEQYGDCMSNSLKLKGNEIDKFSDALKHLGWNIYHDLRDNRIWYSHEGQSPEPSNDRAMAYLRLTLPEHFIHKKLRGGKMQWVPYLLTKDLFYDIRDAHSLHNTRDVFRDYLDGLPSVEVKGSDIEDYNCRIDWYINDLLGGKCDVYQRHISRMLFLSAIWRAYEPGYKIDEVAVLKGRQGVGKDTLLQNLVPRPEMFTTSFGFNMSMKEKIEVTRGKVFVIASEMGGVTTTKDLESLKNYITAQHDDIRMSYRRDADSMPRRYVFACTTNLSRPLPNDPTGNRRWCVVTIDESKVGPLEPWIEERRNDLWSEAVALYRKGVRPNLPREMKSFQEGSNDANRRVDEQLDTAIAEAIDNGKLKTDRPLMMSEVAIACDLANNLMDFLSTPKELQHRLRDALEVEGWKSKKGLRSDLKTVRLLWYPPQCQKKELGNG